MSRVALLFAVAFLATAVLPTGAAPVSSPASFATSLVVAKKSSGEPSLALDTRSVPATAYYTMPGVGSVWKSLDGGITWAQGASGIETNGDTSIAVDADGVVYLSALTDSAGINSVVPIQVSIDGGASFIRAHNFEQGATGVTCDRQWTAARGHGEAVTTVRCGSVNYAWRTTDAGVTWSAPITAMVGALTVGPLAYAPNGNLYQAYLASGANLRVARSSDGGLTWGSFYVVGNYEPVGFPVVAADAANHVYVAYDDGNTVFGTGLVPISSSVFVATSNDGENFTSIKQVSDGVHTGIFPWIAAGVSGKVDVAWYSMYTVTNTMYNLQPGVSDVGDPTSRWDVIMAQSLNANATSPNYLRNTAVTGFHKGSICTSGLACAGPQNLGFGNAPTPFDRRVLDFFEMRVDPATGNAIIAYPQDRALGVSPLGDAIFSWLDFRVARQTGGTTLG